MLGIIEMIKKDENISVNRNGGKFRCNDTNNKERH